MIVSSGSGGGLSLQVNIEQYEYMQGPNEGAGLKVLIHDNAKTTLVKDNALAIRPGTHSFIASKITQVFIKIIFILLINLFLKCADSNGYKTSNF